MRSQTLSTITLGCLMLLPRQGVAADPPPARWQLEVAATGGFAGLPSVEVQTQPHYTCGTATQCAPDKDNVDVVKIKSYSWKPAVSTGLVFRRLLKKDLSTKTAEQADDLFGIGVGAHFVFVPRGADKVSPAPALAVHVGKARMQVFLGAIFAPSDDVTLPGGGSRVTVPGTVNASSFPVVSGGRGPNFFAGIVIGGVPVLKASSPGTQK